ncbi:MAG: response regulator [Alphaproteobacteria bacterium]|nr:response regulator [Alphaproteobacteria bacterium]
MTKPSIVFVDDEPNLLSGLRRLTRGHADKWDMAFLASAEEALKFLAQAPVHLLISDMRMPGMDGAELMEKISETSPGIVCFALSGETDAQRAIRVVGKSHRFLAKPIDPDTLLNSIDTLFASGGVSLEENRKRNTSVFDILKSAPGRLHALETLLARPEPDGIAINAQIMADPSLSTRVLQIANSAYFGKPLATCNLPRAISSIGLARLTQLLARGRLGTEQAQAEGAADAYRLHAMAAVMAREQAEATNKSAELQDLAYAIALLCGIGAGVDDGGQTCLSRPGCIATVFGLPQVLAHGLSRYDGGGCTNMDEVEMAASALAIAAEVLVEAKVAA